MDLWVHTMHQQHLNPICFEVKLCNTNRWLNGTLLVKKYIKVIDRWFYLMHASLNLIFLGKIIQINNLNKNITHVQIIFN